MGPSKRSRQRSRRAPAVGVERLEGRALLATVAGGLPSSSAASPGTGTGTASIQVQPMTITNPKPHGRALTSGSQGNGASADGALNVGQQYTNLVLSSGTRRVGWHYVKAAFFGDINALDSLGRTNAVRRVGQSFTQLGHSSQIQALSHSFDRLGTSISNQFQKIFG
jgi:hypothetical protein